MNREREREKEGGIMLKRWREKMAKRGVWREGENGE